jgi:hypothetical protein
MTLLAGVEAKLRFALQYAVLAPSSHNSQPWHFIVDGDSVMLRISAMVISRFGERDQYGSWCCAVREL